MHIILYYAKIYYIIITIISKYMVLFLSLLLFLIFIIYIGDVQPDALNKEMMQLSSIVFF